MKHFYLLDKRVPVLLYTYYILYLYLQYIYIISTYCVLLE